MPDQTDHTPTPEPEAVRFGMELTAATPEARMDEYHANWRKAEAAVAAGQAICISDLMCQAEQLHSEAPVRKARRTKLDKLIAEIQARK